MSCCEIARIKNNINLNKIQRKLYQNRNLIILYVKVSIYSNVFTLIEETLNRLSQ